MSTLASHKSFPDTFQAYVYESFGDPLQEIKLRSGVAQSPLLAHQVRIKVHAAGFNPIDANIIEWGRAFPHNTSDPTTDQPFRTGFDAAGELVEVGQAVEGFQVGDAVYAMAYYGSLGTLAEYVVLDAKYVAHKPTNMMFNEAAGVPCVGLTSYQCLTRYGKVKPGDHVLILGGSSATGLFGIQIAKALGAYVLATTSARNTKLVQSMGADEVIDYTSVTWSDVIAPHSIDLIYSCVEPNAWNEAAQKVLKEGTGHFVTIEITEDIVDSPIGATHTFVVCDSNAKDLATLTGMIESGQLITPIDSVHAFDKLLDVVKIQRTGHARGKLVLEVVPSSDKLP